MLICMLLLSAASDLAVQGLGQLFIIQASNTVNLHRIEIEQIINENVFSFL
jgi:hypothetical protein